MSNLNYKFTFRLILFRFIPIVVILTYIIYLLFILEIEEIIPFRDLFFILFLALNVILIISYFKVKKLQKDVLEVIYSNSTPKTHINHTMSEIFWGVELLSALKWRDFFNKIWLMSVIIIIVISPFFDLIIPMFNPDIVEIFRPDIPFPFLITLFPTAYVFYFSWVITRELNIPPWIRFQLSIQILQRYDLATQLYDWNQFKPSIVNPNISIIQRKQFEIFSKCLATLFELSRYIFFPITPKELSKYYYLLLLLYLKDKKDEYNTELQLLYCISKKQPVELINGLLSYFSTLPERYNVENEEIDKFCFDIFNESFYQRIIEKFKAGINIITSFKDII